MAKVGDRVRLLDKPGQMREFAGALGQVVGDTERDGRTKMYRIRLDNPVEINGLGLVYDDIWSSPFFRKVR